jgi:hypothetical protein
MDVPVLDYADPPERGRIFGKALLDRDDRRVGRLEEEDAAEVGEGEVRRAGVLH